MIASLLLILISADPAASRAEIDFATEIMPVLTKAGCNAGACHGAAAGRGGFRLSLLGSDATSDYEAIVHALEGRRINLAKPAASLLLKKATGYIDHGGEVALDEQSAGAQRLTEWIKAGAPRGSGRQLVELQVSPRQQIVERIPAEVHLRVMARFDDGPATDVTPWTVFTPADSVAVELREENNSIIAIVKRRGPQVIIARFLDRVVPLQVIVPLSEQPVDLSREPQVNFIDEEINRGLTILRIPVSPAADDATWLRRVRLDLTGRLPEPGEVKAYARDTAADKRQRLVDKLLASDEFADYWTLRFARQLRLHSLPNEQVIAETYARWIRTQIAQGTPFNAWAKELFTATGDSHQVGPANFGRMVNDAREQAELVGEFFLGARLGCANCHNHPLDRWTQDDYHGLAAVFAKLERGRHVKLSARGEVTNLRTGDPAIPRIPGERDLTAATDPLSAAADWLTSDANELFARATVNRLWQAVFSRGLVEPVDDLRETNPATHPELLDRLARDFVAHRYDLRHTLRRIALSATYARSGQILPGNALDDRFYSHFFRRPLGAEVLADAIADVTGVPTEFKNAPPATRAVRVVDPLSPAPALDLLGRCSRAAGCDDQRQAGGLPAQLHLLNGDLLNRKLIDKQGRLQQLLAAAASNEELVVEFYLRGLGREPTREERTRWCERLKSNDAQDHAQRCEDFVWSLL
jgi:hypothetical protein